MEAAFDELHHGDEKLDLGRHEIGERGEDAHGARVAGLGQVLVAPTAPDAGRAGLEAEIQVLPGDDADLGVRLGQPAIDELLLARLVGSYWIVVALAATPPSSWALRSQTAWKTRRPSPCTFILSPLMRTPTSTARLRMTARSA